MDVDGVNWKALSATGRDVTRDGSLAASEGFKGVVHDIP